MSRQWNTRLYPFDEQHPEGAPCIVIVENGMEMRAACLKHHPVHDEPDLWQHDWRASDPRCQDKKNGRLYGEQAVTFWRLDDTEKKS